MVLKMVRLFYILVSHLMHVYTLCMSCMFRRGLCMEELGTCQFDRKTLAVKSLTDGSEGA